MNNPESSRLSFLSPMGTNDNAPLFVYLPGMDGTGELLHLQAPDLALSFDLRCLAIPPDDLSDWQTLAQQVIDLIKGEITNKSQQDVYLCGESFGGCLALQIAITAPWLWTKMILINPATSFRQRPWLSLGIPIIPRLPQGFYSRSTFAFLPFLAAVDRIEPSDRQALLTRMQVLPQKFVQWRLSLLKEFTIERSQLQRLTQPVLLIASAADLLLPSVKEARRLSADLPNNKLVILPHSGHACLLEKEVDLYSLLKTNDFLEINNY